MRDDKWLFAKLDEVWDTFFSDVPQDNDVKIVWGRKARNRLGSIKQVVNPKSKAPLADTSALHGQARNKQISNSKNLKFNSNFKFQISNSQDHPTTIVTINSLFKDEKIPEYVVTGTIAHELAHYAHGFHSPLEQKFATPHAGGVVHKEMDGRGLAEVRKKQRRWLKENWREYVDEKLPRKKAVRRKVIIRWR